MAADAGDFYCVLVASHLCGEGFDAGQGGSAVGSGGEIGEAGGSFGESAEQCVTVTDTFVAGQAEAALDVAGGVDEAFGGGSLQRVLRMGSVAIVNGSLRLAVARLPVPSAWSAVLSPQLLVPSA